MFTTAPPSPASINGTAVLVSAWAVATLKWNARSMKPGEVSRNARGIAPPTLLTTTSRRPNASCAVWGRCQMRKHLVVVLVSSVVVLVAFGADAATHGVTAPPSVVVPVVLPAPTAPNAAALAERTALLNQQAALQHAAVEDLRRRV